VTAEFCFLSRLSICFIFNEVVVYELQIRFKRPWTLIW